MFKDSVLIEKTLIYVEIEWFRLKGQSTANMCVELYNNKCLMS